MPRSRPTRMPSKTPIAAVLLLTLSLAAGGAVAGPEEDARAQNALRVLTEVQAIPESAIPDKLLDEARAIVVIPDTLKVGLVLGGRRGHGLLSVKSPDGTWSSPSFVKITGGSIGFQAGVQSSDVVLVFTSERGLESIIVAAMTGTRGIAEDSPAWDGIVEGGLNVRELMLGHEDLRVTAKQPSEQVFTGAADSQANLTYGRLERLVVSKTPAAKQLLDRRVEVVGKVLGDPSHAVPPYTRQADNVLAGQVGTKEDAQHP